jgi:hypothetical protein
VYAAAKRKGELLIVRGAGHNDVAERGGREYWSWLEKAIGDAAVGAVPASDDQRRLQP